jgi:hypothetical protein
MYPGCEHVEVGGVGTASIRLASVGHGAIDSDLTDALNKLTQCLALGCLGLIITQSP